MRVSELKKFLATRVYPTYLACYRSPGRWCEVCEHSVHPADVVISAVTILDAGDGIAVTKDRFCCFPVGMSLALHDVSFGALAVIVGVLDSGLPDHDVEGRALRAGTGISA